MNTGDSSPPSPVRPSDSSGWNAETLAAAGFVVGYLVSRTRIGRLALVVAAGSLAWRWLAKPPVRVPQPATDPEPTPLGFFTDSPEQPTHFNDEYQPDHTASDTAETPFTAISVEEIMATVIEPQMDAEVEAQSFVVEPKVSATIEYTQPPELPIHNSFVVAVQDEHESPAPVAFALETSVEKTESPMLLAPSVADSAAWLLGLEPIPVIHEEPAWNPLAVFAMERLSPKTSGLAMGAEIPDQIEIPTPIESLAISAPMVPEEVPSKPITRGLLGKLFEALEDRPKTSPLASIAQTDGASISPPPSPMVAMATPLNVEPVKPIGIRLPPPRTSPRPASWLAAEITAKQDSDMPSAVIDRISTKAATLPATRHIVPRAPVTAGDSGKKAWLNWWK